ncbi:hypothetical protein J2X06_002609 [Lysobacter niastensis]|uniref:Uncharacterized protein n=1 Tax=Lysobacter niastensis TaxID=380629 RepID=A0ABU1WDG1_9GAMM|nr:hypothetical protein [Lysobacter niastensis]MDR7135400.1 hypothetical protein [Lysobacter niastensis]
MAENCSNIGSPTDAFPGGNLQDLGDPINLWIGRFVRNGAVESDCEHHQDRHTAQAAHCGQRQTFLAVVGAVS